MGQIARHVCPIYGVRWISIRNRFCFLNRVIFARTAKFGVTEVTMEEYDRERDNKIDYCQPN